MSEAPPVSASGETRQARRGMMLVLSSPSGGGKTTLARMLIEAEASRCCLSISVTTRAPRPGEEEGKDYVFVSRAEFEARRASGHFLEWAEVFGQLYGTPRESVEAALAAGHDIVFDIDWQGARQLYASAPGDVVRVFILPPSRAALAARLQSRASDPPEVVAMRLAGAAEEIAHWREYDYVLVNRDLEESFAALRAILIAERSKRERNPGLERLVRDLLAE